MLLGLLVGNSTLKCGVLEGASVLAAAAADVEAVGLAVEAIERIASPYAVRGTAVGSVRDDLWTRLAGALPARYRPIRVARRDFPIPIENAYARPEEAGTDRLLEAVAAARRSEGRGAVVVDFGTAVSVSVVSPEGVFLGGSIAAGWRPIAAGLAARLPRLPELDRSAPRPAGDPRREFRLVARDARSALAGGTFWEIAGGVRAIVAGTLRELDFRPLVLATGGDAGLFAPGIPEIDAVVPELALEGLGIAASSGGGA